MIVMVYDKIVNELIGNGIIEQGDRAIYRYGLEQGAIMALNLATTVVIGSLFGMFWESIIFTIVYTPLRSNAGGYHARTWRRCYLLSAAMIAAALSVIRLTAFNSLVCGIMVTVGAIAILLMAPVESEGKPLDGTEKVVYRRRSRHILTVWIAVFVICMTLGWSTASATVATAVAVLGGMVCLGKAIKNRRIKR